jgi:hypothetical protein
MKTTLLLTLLLIITLVGCGSGGGTTTSTTYTDMTVERGPVIGAYVVDNNGKRAINIGNGQYRFYTTPSYPINAYGGYIDVNRNGEIDLLDAELTISLSLAAQDQNKITLLTTIADLSSDIKNELLLTYALSENELYTLTPSTSLKVAAISDTLFKYCIDNNTTLDTFTLNTLQTLENNITTTITQYENSTDNILSTITQNEINLIDDLNISLGDLDTNLTEVSNEIAQSSTYTKDPTTLINAMPLYELNSTDSLGLIYMYQEEKLARDVYNYLYNKWGIRIFSNIAKSEQIHMDAVKALLEKYSLTIPTDTANIYELAELQNLYSSLIAQGNISSIEALKVGKLVEETDITDLLERIDNAPEDIKTVYQSLLNGSYNHLNAFNKLIP